MLQTSQPNLVFLLADQLRAASLPVYGGTLIETPNIDRLAAEGVTLDNCISTCPVCTPYRAMMVTGRHPQTTGHIVNFLKTRHSEISIGDAFARAGYQTAWIGKWHLHAGSFPANGGAEDWVPRGRDRLGFNFWRGYNLHMEYFDGFVNSPDRDYDTIRWEGYETEALNRYAFEFLDSCGQSPFAMFLSPHMPHWGYGKKESKDRMAPDKYYERLPEKLPMVENVSKFPMNEAREATGEFAKSYRNYLAMVLALDDMLGELLDDLERRGVAENTIFVFTSDHGTQGGAQGLNFWKKKSPYEESLKVPCIIRWPGGMSGNRRSEALTAPVDFFPSLCSLCGVPAPRSVEGYDLSAGWQGAADAWQQKSVFCMNFGSHYNHYADGEEWRGVRTQTHQYTRWLDGRVELFDLKADPLEQTNLAGQPASTAIEMELENELRRLQAQRGDEMLPGTAYRDWVDYQRRPIRNAFGTLSHPESEPDWSLFQ